MDLKKGVLGISLAVGLALCSSLTLAAYTETFSYDANGFLASHTDKNGVTTTYINNARGLQESRTEAAGTPAARTITTQWHAQYSLPLSITEPGKVTAYTYNPQGQMLTRTVTDTATGESRTWAYTYNSLGLIATVDGPRADVSDVTTYTYDTQGNLTASTNALGHSTQITAHDASGRPLTLVDANGVETTLTYDLRGRLLTRTTLGQTTSFTYDPVGNLTRITLPTGGYIDYTYDDARRLIAISDADGNRIDYTVDLMGNRTAEEVVDGTGVLARSRSMVYDQFSRLIQTVGAANQTTAYSYDGNGNTTQVTDALSRPIQQAFDALDRLINVTDPALGQTQYAYDAQDNLVEVDDPRGVVTQYSYNAFGEVVELNSPDTGVTTYAYDPAGNLTQLTDARGVTVNYAYDALNRITDVTYSDPLLNVTYAYDQGTNGIGRLTGITDSNGATVFEYDAHGNVAAVTRLQGTTSYTVEYSYDAANNVVGITYPSGRTVSYTRDPSGKVTRVSTTFATQTAILADTIDYEPFGPANSLTYGNGLTLTQTYDLDGQLVGQTVSGAREVSLGYDAVGNITDITDALGTLEDHGFSYNELDRLTGANGDYGSLSWTYDLTGNRLTELADAAQSTYSIESASNRLLGISGATSRTYTYDANGNVISDGVYSYSFDLTNRLIGASGSGMTAAYAYNGLGQRAEKQVNGQTMHFVYGQSGELLGEYPVVSGTAKEYVWLDGQPLAMAAGSQLVYLHTDQLGTPRTGTDASGTVIWRWASNPFGSTAANSDPDGNGVQVTLNLRFPGQYYDAETGLHYNYFRDYDPETGRYIESDPIGLKAGVNTYAYVGGNPIIFFDPFGLEQWGDMVGGLTGSPIHELPSNDSSNGWGRLVFFEDLKRIENDSDTCMSICTLKFVDPIPDVFVEEAGRVILGPDIGDAIKKTTKVKAGYDYVRCLEECHNQFCADLDAAAMNMGMSPVDR